MLNSVLNYIRDEDGAVTVDWVVLTSAIVGLALAVVLTIAQSSVNAADSISTRIDAAEVMFQDEEEA